MGLHKGQKNNPNGRPVGSRNKVTADLRERINDFLNENWENLQKEFDKLEPKEKLMFYEKLLQYGIPKLQNVELEIPPPEPKPQLVDEELHYLSNKELILELKKLDDET